MKDQEWFGRVTVHAFNALLSAAFIDGLRVCSNGKTELVAASGKAIKREPIGVMDSARRGIGSTRADEPLVIRDSEAGQVELLAP